MPKKGNHLSLFLSTVARGDASKVEHFLELSGETLTHEEIVEATGLADERHHITVAERLRKYLRSRNA